MPKSVYNGQKLTMLVKTNTMANMSKTIPKAPETTPAK